MRLTLQQLVGAAERLESRERHGGVKDDWLARVEEARDRLAQAVFEPLPLNAFVVESGGKERLVASPQNPDRLIQEALIPILTKAIEPLLSPAVHAYRKGRSAATAAWAASQAVAREERHISKLDIRDYFPSIDLRRLEALTADLLPEDAVRLIFAFLRAPRRLNERLVQCENGLPLGQPLSPALANLYLVGVDRAMASHPVTYLRYSDDLLIAATSASDVLAAEATLIAHLSALGLQLAAEKTDRFEAGDEPFVYLGHAVGNGVVYEKLSGDRERRLAQAPPGHAGAPSTTGASPTKDASEPARTLYLTEHGVFVSLREGMARVSKGRATLREIPLRRIDRVMALAGLSMTSGFIGACVQRDIPILFIGRRGGNYGALVPGGLPNPLRLRAQYDLLSDTARRVSLARSIVAAKLSAMLRRLTHVSAAGPCRRSIEDLLPKLEGAQDLDALRGYEGAATKVYYEAFRLRVKPPEFGFGQRTKRPPKDPMNSLLSFAYTLVFGEVHTGLLAAGLDPHPGLLHDLRSGHAALASDLSEPYRVLIADSFVLDLVNKGQVTVHDFESLATGGCYLKDEPRRKVLRAYEAFVGRRPGGKGSAPRLLIQGACSAMRRVVLGEERDLALPLGLKDLHEEDGNADSADL